MTTLEVYNQVMEAQAMVYSSLYVQKGTKLVRFANHKCKDCNIQYYNDGVEEIFLVYVSSGLSELEIQKNVDEISTRLGIYVDYSIVNEESDIDLTKFMVNRFLA